MKSFALLLVEGAGMVCVMQWWQIVYRLHLFYADYQAKPGVNHIGDGDFSMIYVANVFLLLAAIFAFRVLRQNKAWKFGAAFVGMLNALSWLALIIMHKTGALVEYGEAMENARRLSH